MAAMPPLTTSPFRGSGGAPPPLSFGFGMHNTNTASTAASSSSMSSPSTMFGNASTLNPNTHSKRQRSVSPSEESDDTMDASHSTSAHSSSSRAFQALPKRMRAGLGGSGSHGSSTRKARISSSSQSPPASGSSSSTADVGKMLATLDKASLLTVFSRLLTSDPSSAEKIHSLIPTPTLTSVEAALEESQRTVRSLLWNASEMRNEFAWGRLRTPVADFVTTTMSFLPFFVVTDEGSTNQTVQAREAPHPSTMYAFLHLITERALGMLADLPETPTNLSISLFSPDAGNDGNPIVNSHESGTPKMILKSYHQVMSSDMEKLSAVNPNAIVSQLIPILLLHWARLLDWIARSVNEEGRMFGAETVRGWLAGLESLTLRNSNHREHSEAGDDKIEIKACKTALCTLGQRMQEQIGWLIGIKNQYH